MEAKTHDTPERSREARETDRKTWVPPELQFLMTVEKITGGPGGGNADAVIGAPGTGFQAS